MYLFFDLINYCIETPKVVLERHFESRCRRHWRSTHITACREEKWVINGMLKTLKQKDGSTIILSIYCLGMARHMLLWPNYTHRTTDPWYWLSRVILELFLPNILQSKINKAQRCSWAAIILPVGWERGWADRHTGSPTTCTGQDSSR